MSLDYCSPWRDDFTPCWHHTRSDGLTAWRRRAPLRCAMPARVTLACALRPNSVRIHPLPIALMGRQEAGHQHEAEKALVS